MLLRYARGVYSWLGLVRMIVHILKRTKYKGCDTVSFLVFNVAKLRKFLNLQKIFTKMYIAIPTAQDQVDNHFGHCAYFTIVELDANNNVVSKMQLPSPQGCGCRSGVATILKNIGVAMMLAGNIGDGAVNVLANNGIGIVRGCSGAIDEVIAAYTKGTLKDAQITCTHECHH